MDNQRSQQTNPTHAGNIQVDHAPAGHAVVHIKNEPISDGIEFENNPWNVESLQAFLCLKCPQCVFDTKEKNSFQNHAIENHPLSIVLFGRTLKEEKYFDKDFNLEDPLLADRIHLEDLHWEPDYLDYCESKLEEFDYEYTKHNEANGIKQEKKPLKRHLQTALKKKDGNECPICKEVLESQVSKMEHVALLHPERKIHHCQYCDFKCLLLKTLKKHKAHKHSEHCDPKLLPKTSNNSTRICRVCKEKFQTRIGMMEHYISNHPDAKVYSCPFCDVRYLQGYRSGNRLEKHISKEHPEHDSDISHFNKKGTHNSCPNCKLVFKSRGLMVKHFTSMHPEEKIYSCSHCNEKYLSLNGLNSHVFNIHERKVTDLGCSFCGKELASKVDLKNHKAIEHKDKKYECSKCEASYPKQISLIWHIQQVHEGKKHQCTTCGEVFDSMYRYETHIAVKHDESRLFKCSLCKSAYTERSSLKKHIAFVHEKVSGHLCPHCGKNFQGKDILRDHILVVHEGKKYHCDLCTKTFTNKSSLRSHVSQIHEGKKPPPVTCTQCQKSFTGKSGKASLKRHMSEVHEGQRPFACHLCGLAFSQSGNLKTHMKGKHKDAI